MSGHQKSRQSRFFPPFFYVDERVTGSHLAIFPNGYHQVGMVTKSPVSPIVAGLMALYFRHFTHFFSILLVLMCAATLPAFSIGLGLAGYFLGALGFYFFWLLLKWIEGYTLALIHKAVFNGFMRRAQREQRLLSALLDDVETRRLQSSFHALKGRYFLQIVGAAILFAVVAWGLGSAFLTATGLIAALHHLLLLLWLKVVDRSYEWDYQKTDDGR